MKKIIIAVDGYSSSGKSTMAKNLAKEIGYIYIDSGAMYRAITLYCMNQGIINGEQIDEERLSKDIEHIHILFQTDPDTGKTSTFLNGENVESEIRDLSVSGKVSYISAIPMVRKAMVRLQQEMGKEKGIVMDGRDIGTTVFPQAEMKVFVTASPEIRAQRRVDELNAKGKNVNFDEVLENIKERDYLDETRDESPLKKADDAHILDNSHMSIEEQRVWLRRLFESIVS